MPITGPLLKWYHTFGNTQQFYFYETLTSYYIKAINSQETRHTLLKGDITKYFAQEPDFPKGEG